MAQPEPAALVESLRAFGYSLRTAIADLIDNSISAEAKSVWLHFEWDGANSWITIRDDGHGMAEDELITAMRAGSKNPLAERPPRDLGRFGLGLKTASFSQCRRLSVMSKRKDLPEATRCWDLDYISECGEWRLLKNLEKAKQEGLLDTQSGTVVIWDKMDRITGDAKTDDNAAYKRFLEAIDQVKEHLAMVFHRYLEKPGRLKIWINNRPIEPWDPFLKNEAATQQLPQERLLFHGQSVLVTPYVLPHQSKITAETHKRAAGPAGWNAQQGLYIYRNERLLVPGDWLGLGFQKEEHHKLARMQVDLPNSLDSEWQIDVKKSRARPPGPLRTDLKRIAKSTRERAVQIYRHRGKVTARRSSQEHVFLWEQKARHGKYYYAINRSHPAIEDAYRNGSKATVEPLLRMLEETVPVGFINVTSSETPESFAAPFEDCTYESVKRVIESLYNSFVSSGCSREDAIARLLTIEPFSHRPEFIQAFQEEQESG
ncbi:ATP-binding protein [Labrenzia sp. OB1]|nr:ATP-binding protein [Labrenzia sp. OB1]